MTGPEPALSTTKSAGNIRRWLLIEINDLGGILCQGSNHMGAGKCRLNVRATAAKLARTHGEDAALVARQWACCAQRAGNPDRLYAWVQVLGLVNKLIALKDLNDKLERDCQIMRLCLGRRPATDQRLPQVNPKAQSPQVVHPAE